MTIGAPTLLTNTTAAATATFTAPTAGSLLVIHARRNNLATTTAITVSAANGTGGAGAYTKVVEAGPGDPASSERAVVFYKVSTGDETSITLTDMSGGTRLIEAYSVAVPAGAGGAWRVLFSATQALATAGLAVLDSVDATSQCSDAIVFAQAIYSSSITAGNEGTWPGFHTRQTSNRFNGSTGTISIGKQTIDSTFTWALDTRRATGTHVAFGYVILPSVTVSNPPAPGSLYGNQSLEATVTGGNTDVAKVEWWRDIAVDTKIGEDLTSPYAITWNTDAETNGSLVVYAKAITAQTSDVATSVGVTYTVADPPASGNIVAIKQHNGSAWVNITSVKYHNGTTWVTVWP